MGDSSPERSGEKRREDEQARLLESLFRNAKGFVSLFDKSGVSMSPTITNVSMGNIELREDGFEVEVKLTLKLSMTERKQS